MKRTDNKEMYKKSVMHGESFVLLTLTYRAFLHDATGCVAGVEKG